MTKAALIISNLQGGDYHVVLVDEERFAQIKEINEIERNDIDAADVISYLLLNKSDMHRPDLYPDRRGRVIGAKFIQDNAIEPSADWPDVHIFAILSVPCT